jgi:uncharacterized RDD family membrane protein YckC
MQINEEAKKLLEKRIQKGISSIELESSDKKDIENEIMSHFYDASFSMAKARSSEVIEKEDVEKAFSESEDPDIIAAEYVKAYLNHYTRAGAISRTMAFIMDIVLVGICILILIAPIAVPLGILSFSPTHNSSGFGVSVLPGIGFGIYLIPADRVIEMVASIVLGFGSLIVFVTYFVVIEGKYGFSPGKKVMNLKVLKENGTRIGYKEAIIRNIPKFFNNLIILDALLMVLLFRKERQRAFDKIAGTIVVHAEKKSWAKDMDDMPAKTLKI